jgi:hypothetical protein
LEKQRAVEGAPQERGEAAPDERDGDEAEIILLLTDIKKARRRH